MRLKRIELEHVHYMPKDLQPGVLYVSKEFGACAHLCACGCGSKVRTPLSKTGWSLTVTPTGPSLYPSIGNWQKPCKSHYWIERGGVVWAEAWSPDQIAAGRQAQEARDSAYYAKLDRERGGLLKRLMRWLQALWNKLIG